MKYTMKAGVLYQEEKMLGRLEGSFSGPAKNIFLADGTLIFQTDIRKLNAPTEATGNIRPREYILREYILFDETGKECAIAKPDYAKEAASAIPDWPICRMQRVNHAQFLYHNNEYRLTMQNSQNYSLTEISGKIVVQIFHRGLIGGWNIEADDKFTPGMICAIFAFCRYIEQENEFMAL